jgi:hypothetical protein
MLRAAYLASLIVLELALATEVAPPVAEALRWRAAIEQAGDGTEAMLRLAITLVAAAGASVALAAPLIALLRHRQRGVLRFVGLRRWAVLPVVAGAAVFAACALAAPWLVDLDRPWADALAELLPPLALAATAAMTGGTVAAELLRRSVAPARLLRDLMPPRRVGIAVADAADLKAHAR